MKAEVTLVTAVASLVAFGAFAESEPDGPQVPSPVPNARIEVHKADRVLRFFSGDDLIREYRVGLGFNPIPPKRKEGDGATPEGEYRVCVKNPKSKYYLSLGISYPNPDDAGRGSALGLISPEEHDQIVDAHNKGVRPPWSTRLGGEIFIHGSGSGADWTWGCIALDNEKMLELYNSVRIGTAVIIKP